MSLTTYNSVRGKDSRKEKPKISQLAQDSFEALHPFINIFDCGDVFMDKVVHLITKRDWQFNKRHKAGERGLTNPNGTKFNPYLQIVCGIYSPKYVHEHIRVNETTYYTSGRKGLGLLYLDIDAHHGWQKDEYRAKAVLEKIFPFGYYRCSKRGQNGYLKVRYSSIQEFNEIADSLERTLTRLFLHLGILCDIEVKGTITNREKSGRLAKLPFNTTTPLRMRDETDNWDSSQLEKFKTCPIVNARRVDHIARRLETGLDEEKIQRTQEIKELLAAKEREAEEEKAKLKKSRTTQPPKRTVPPKPPVSEPTRQPASSVRFSLPAPSRSDDAFKRNHKDIPPFIRAFYKRHRRFPTSEETLDWLKANGLYSGEWEENERERAVRVGQILRFKEQTFDPKELSGGKEVSLRLGRFAWWVRQRFGSAMSARVADLRRFDPVSMTAPTVEVKVPGRFIETFMVVADVCLNQDPLDNKAVPTSRFKKLWGMVSDGSPWNQRYFQIVRDRLDQMGVIKIFDRKHGEGKAWRWEVGSSFPGSSWKDDQRKLKKKGLFAGLALSFEELAGSTYPVMSNKAHNTLYEMESPILGTWGQEEVIRPPP
jgi:hypothetical protein